MSEQDNSSSSDLIGLANFSLLDDDYDLDLIPTQKLFFQRKEERYGAPVSGEDLHKKFVESVPKKTRENNKWAVKLWKDWSMHRNTIPETYSENPSFFPVPVEISMASIENLQFWMPRFINEIRRKDGTDYPPNTLTNIAAGIQRYLREECNRPAINFLKKDDPTFDLFRKSLDSRMKELTNMGIGTKVNRADPVLIQDEEQLWKSEVLNMDTAQGLSNCVFFYNCKLFAFRAKDEHRNLDSSQFSINHDHETGLSFLEFHGRSCKNVQGGLKHKKVETKNIKHYEQQDNKHCVVKIYEKYLSLIPNAGPFYRRPMEGNVLKFSSQVIGEKKLGVMMKKLFLDAGIDTTGRKITNHSGKVGCCTSLFNSGFDDQTVRSRSGHRSSAVELYKRPLKELEMKVSNALNAPMMKENIDKENINKENINLEDKCDCVPSEDQKEKPKDSTVCEQSKVLTLIVPNEIETLVIEKNGKRIKLSL